MPKDPRGIEKGKEDTETLQGKGKKRDSKKTMSKEIVKEKKVRESIYDFIENGCVARKTGKKQGG